MKTFLRTVLAGLAFAVLGLPGAHAQEPPATEGPQVEAPEPAVPQVEAPDAPAVEAADAESAQGAEAQAEEPIVWTRDRPQPWRGFRSHDDNAIVSVGGDSRLEAGMSADAVISIFGSSTSLGNVREAVVSVFGNTAVEAGTVNEAAVAVLGDNTVNTLVRGDVVAVLGDVNLGPQADVHGNVVVIGGVLHRDPAAQLRGGVQQIFGMPPGTLDGVRSWVRNCFALARPLGFAPGLGWAWAIALGFLGLYIALALMLRDPVDRCVKTLREHTGKTVLASLLAMVLTPVLYVVLAITVIGIAFIPVASFAFLLATLFGKAVVLAWIGRGVLRIFDEENKLHTALAVAVGGAIVLLLYVVPVVGFIVFKVLGILALGVVVLTLLQINSERRRATPPPPAYAAAGGGPVGGTPAYPPAGSAAFSSETSASGTGMPGTEPPGTGASAAGVPGTGSPDSGGSYATGSPGTGPSPGGFAATPGGPAYAVPPGSAPPAAALEDVRMYERAGFWIRMLALFIDAAIIAVALAALSNEGKLFLLGLATYAAIMWKMKGTTVGGLVCNLKVARLDGRPIDWSTAVVRALGCFLSLIILGLGFIWIAFDEGRQAWHDKIAGTVVVRVPQGVSLV